MLSGMSLAYSRPDRSVQHPNPGQEDDDGDGIGNACEADSDNDGVIDDFEGEGCSGTLTGPVDEMGCSIVQLCPCDGWKNHGQYVSCTARAAEDFLANGLITEEVKDEVTSAAAQNQCSKKRGKR